MRRVLLWGMVLATLAACAGERAELSDPPDLDAAEAVVDVAEHPSVDIPEDRAPPGELVVEELIGGDGPAVEDGDVVTLHVIGVNWETGERVVSSWDRGAPRTFAVDTLIPGVREAITGVAVGSRVRVVVPPEHGYGEEAPSGLGADDTIVFLIDLVSIG